MTTDLAKRPTENKVTTYATPRWLTESDSLMGQALLVEVWTDGPLNTHIDSARIITDSGDLHDLTQSAVLAMGYAIGGDWGEVLGSPALPLTRDQLTG